MTPEERSRALRQEADQVLDLIRLRELCAPIGRLMPTGSYFLDLMMYPDIDFNLPLTTPERLLSVGVELSKLECVKRIRYLRGGQGPLKDGFYLKPEINYGNWGRLWKIDIWSLPSVLLESTEAEMVDLRSRMTPEHRAIILDTKYRLLTDEGRTPMYSGIYIYKAVINEGMTELDGIVEFLNANGIVL
ncbi:hypothetical protein ACFLSZ_02590 [Candidatus Bipolaricaulota bacterium]